MKKKWILAALSLCCLAFTSCAFLPQTNSSSTDASSSSQKEDKVHVHNLVKVPETESTCSKEGNIEFYFCTSCNGYYLDEDAKEESSLDDTRAPLLPHAGTKQDGTPATCGENGIVEHWKCSECDKTFADEDCTEILYNSDLLLPKLAHEGMEYRAGYPVNGDKNGRVEHWYCAHCNGFFLDAQGKVEVDELDVILHSAVNIPDFLVTVPAGRDPVVLQLTDTQIIDGKQRRPEHSSGDEITYAPQKISQYCYDYLRETINKTNPDLILLTGDLVYGAYDDNGSVLVNLINFLDTFQIPWAPVFGNHEGESKKGIDWQCEQLENSKYCLFKQNNLTGNSNYSVGILQGGKLTRVFYMLDSNGCTTASAETLSNGQTTTMVGFGSDQIEWYTTEIQNLKALSPETKISFAFHIQLAVFGEAYQQYGFDNNQKYQDIYIDYLSSRKNGDFGYLGRQMKDAWDKSKTVYNGLKALGVDSIFVGHEHCNSASVVYEGIRFQYGQKSSEYDRYNSVGDNGKIGATAIYEKTGTPLVGGSVIVLSEANGEIKDAYIYYCESAGGNVDWSYYQKSKTMQAQKRLQNLMLGSILAKKEQ